MKNIKKTNLAEKEWIEQIQHNLSVYKCQSLTLPLIEKVNVNTLITQIAGDRSGIERTNGVNLLENLKDFRNILKSDGLDNIWIIENLGSLWQSASTVDRQILEQNIIDLAVTIRDRTIAILIIDYGDIRLPKHLKSLIPHQELPLPSTTAIKSILAEFRLESIRLNTIAAGLGCEELRVGIRLALKSTNETLIDYDSIEQSLLKYKIVKLKELGLEFLGEPDISEFGGLDRLKAAVIETVHDFSAHAQELGIARPKGMMFVGPPGSGKTHTAKCIAGQLRWPLISVGIDAIKAGGADVLKILLNRIEATAPCVVYFDELDKFFSSASDPQILGVLLTWLQEKTSETFVLATLNRLEKLPPELTRAGRFDRLFWVGFPNETERYEIIRLYANKYDKAFKTTYGRLDRVEWLNLLNTTDKFTGAELKSLVDRSAKLEFYNRIEWIQLLERIASAEGDEQVALVDNAMTLDLCQRTEWQYELDQILQYTDDELNDRIEQIRTEPLQIHYKNLVSARKDVVSLYERNPAGILDIQNQAEKFSEPSSSPNNDDASLFKVEAINIFGD
jgi:ATPase family associated with various cellular activities (AAA)